MANHIAGICDDYGQFAVCANAECRSGHRSG